uniref:Proteasome subunit beta n=1 Tax=Haptolina brevifila TaxID=156173 RepID=A0A7S2IBD5_9EUKA|mmetsp:Transcript_64145/g.126740  ORF Transcript_64145/g.126740 Transcript_64145/m.126740 type:complete len:231 (+) Transcript_64145:93-785(+)|eukprot:CAMPEP_0174721522 /NCGR_PEP_ID=MMETSP1094-20130205/36435_1 /TAXON_ID=156173 /ORGANISM="Chrysochromulina brevifilum, Strain UTEX LB 985" /LENGTH=230 /DNA_ID=CAMNT_0015922237 /DNA_START=78 /DNA_END=770 /DNA_ORIENTATION=-
MASRTQQPIVTGGSVVALKYAGGVLVATDTLCSYGSLARYPDLSRMKQVGNGGDTLLAAGGDYSDYQQILKMIDMRATHEFALDDGASMAPAAMHHWLTRVLYQRRSKMDPLWNSLIIAGFRNGESYLGTSDLYGTMYTDNFIATGLGAHMALPLLRKSWRADLTEAEARKILEDCMRVLFYRDTRAGSKIQIGKVDSSGSAVDEPHALETFWEHPEFVRGGGYLGDGSW